MRKAVVAVVVVALVAGLAWKIYTKVTETTDGGGRGRGAGGGAIVAVEVAAVSSQSIRDLALFSGSLFPKSYITVAPKVAGRLERLMVDIGDAVNSGDLIAVIDDDEYTQQVEQARAELKVAEANVQEAESSLEAEKREFDRVTALREKKIASESEFDTARARYEAQEARHKVALAQVTQREAALKAAEVRLSYTKITVAWEDSASDCFVGERFADEGAMLRANDPIVSLIDISSLTAVVHVIERDYSKIGVGQKASLTTDAFPDLVVEGTIVRVAPLLKESSRQARIEIEVDNRDRLLKPGMFIIAQVEFERHENATVVPVEALARRDGIAGVFTADLAEETAHFVPVEIGIRGERVAEILKPPLSGYVVTLGQHLLSDGAAINVTDAPRAADSSEEPGGALDAKAASGGGT
ncbi:MAG: efflux RND transporter periplasmic adaptor subunit [Planctomycetota bacterium]|jgi:RND family efflux transporter MFP subunit